MTSSSADTTSAIMASDQVIWRLDSTICDQCQDQCYSVEGVASGQIGRDSWKTYVAWIEHVSQAQALATLSRLIGRNADKVRRRELAVALIETQGTLW